MTTPTTRRPTIRDVAKAAGVSYGTVSRFLNGGHWVSPDAATAVQKAIAATGYTTNHHARSLATGKSGSLAFLLTEEHQRLFGDPTFAILIRGAAASLATRGMTLVLLVAGTDEERANVARFVGGGHVDGVMLISSHEADPLIDSIIEAGVPTVSCGEPLGHRDDVAVVSIDEVASARAMTEYLRSRGHRRIAMISGPLDTPGGKYRLAGFTEAMGTDFDEDLVEFGDFSQNSGAEATRRLLDRGATFEALFAASDLMAIGAIGELRTVGLNTPDDVAVAGFDDSGPAALHTPALTTMRQPWEQITEDMLQVLSDMAKGAPRRHVILPTQLVIRESA